MKTFSYNLDLIKPESINNGYLKSGSPKLDSILGGGIRLGETTEIYGRSGIGKTTLGIQLSCIVRLPKEYGGLNASSIYIDTEGDYHSSRVEEISDELINNDNIKSNGVYEKNCTHIFRITKLIDQLSFVETLHDFIKDNNSNIKLIIFDSFSFHLRTYQGNYGNRNRWMITMLQKLSSIAFNNALAVVIINQVTLRLKEGSYSVEPVLGEICSHLITTRIKLEWQDNNRIASLVKSSVLKYNSKTYVINSSGFL